MSALRNLNTRRLLDVTYGYFGVPMTYARAGAVLFSGIGRITVNDAEQTLDGQKVEVDMKGFNLRLRKHLLDDGFTVIKGDTVTLDAPFEGYTLFHVDSHPRAFGRGGDQHLVGLTPLSDLAQSPETAVKPKGLNLA